MEFLVYRMPQAVICMCFSQPYKRFSVNRGSIFRSYPYRTIAAATLEKPTEGTNREGHRGLTGRPIVGGERSNALVTVNPALKPGKFLPKISKRRGINPLTREEVATLLGTAKAKASR